MYYRYNRQQHVQNMTTIMRHDPSVAPRNSRRDTSGDRMSAMEQIGGICSTACDSTSNLVSRCTHSWTFDLKHLSNSKTCIESDGAHCPVGESKQYTNVMRSDAVGGGRRTKTCHGKVPMGNRSTVFPGSNIPPQRLLGRRNVHSGPHRSFPSRSWEQDCPTVARLCLGCW